MIDEFQTTQNTVRRWHYFVHHLHITKLLNSVLFRLLDLFSFSSFTKSGKISEHWSRHLDQGNRNPWDVRRAVAMSASPAVVLRFELQIKLSSRKKNRAGSLCFSKAMRRISAVFYTRCRNKYWKAMLAPSFSFPANEGNSWNCCWRSPCLPIATARSFNSCLRIRTSRL